MMNRPTPRAFVDIVERPHLELSGRWREQEVQPTRTYTPDQIASLSLAPPPEERPRVSLRPYAEDGGKASAKKRGAR